MDCLKKAKNYAGRSACLPRPFAALVVCGL
ncbi:MAG: hypothetical protein HON06_07040 [Candidatus Puniceispirillum sp.]|nr:hypothetical protein [Candidatus Puniceispirillum sp.]